MPMYNATKPTVVDGTTTEFQVGSRGSLHVELWGNDAATAISQATAGDAASNAGAALYTIARGALYNGTTWDRETKVATVARLLSAAASTNATSVKASAGNIFKIVGVNTNAAARYLKIHNKASAPTVGTDTPTATLYLPPSTVNGGQFEFNFGAQPLYLGTGIAYALTTAAADADTGALTGGDVVALNIFYT